MDKSASLSARYAACSDSRHVKGHTGHLLRLGSQLLNGCLGEDLRPQSINKVKHKKTSREASSEMVSSTGGLEIWKPRMPLINLYSVMSMPNKHWRTNPSSFQTVSRGQQPTIQQICSRHIHLVAALVSPIQRCVVSVLVVDEGAGNGSRPSIQILQVWGEYGHRSQPCMCTSRQSPHPSHAASTQHCQQHEPGQTQRMRLQRSHSSSRCWHAFGVTGLGNALNIKQLSCVVLHSCACEGGKSIVP